MSSNKAAIVIAISGLLIWGVLGCALIELSVDTQVTSRTLSEAKRDPETIDSAYAVQGSERTREKTSANQSLLNKKEGK